MYKKGVREEEGEEENGRWSVLQKSGHLPQLINYSPPGKRGWGNDEAPAAAWGRASGGQSCSGPSCGAAARARGSLGWWRWAGGDSAATGGSHAGPLGLHLVTLAPAPSAPTAGLGLWLETAGCSWLWSPERASFISRWGCPNCWSSRGAPLFSFGQRTLFC